MPFPIGKTVWQCHSLLAQKWSWQIWCHTWCAPPSDTPVPLPLCNELSDTPVDATLVYQTEWHTCSSTLVYRTEWHICGCYPCVSDCSTALAVTTRCYCSQSSQCAPWLEVYSDSTVEMCVWALTSGGGLKHVRCLMLWPMILTTHHLLKH